MGDLADFTDRKRKMRAFRCGVVAWVVVVAVVAIVLAIAYAHGRVTCR